MFRKQTLLSLISLGLVFTSCDWKKKNEPVVVIENTLLDSIFSGTYEGVIPCSNCPGNEISIRIYKDSTISRTSFFEDIDVFPETKIGKWVLKDSIFEATFDKEKLFYKIKNGKTILRVGSDLREIKGEFANDYVLTRAKTFDTKNINWKFIAGDSLNEYKMISLSPGKNNTINVNFKTKTKQDSTAYQYNFVANVVSDNTIESKNIKKGEKGTVSILFTRNNAHLKYENLVVDSLTFPNIPLDISLEGSYKKINPIDSLSQIEK